MTTLPTPITASIKLLSRPRAVIRRMVVALAALRRARAHRREVADVLRLDDRMLKDIGLVRADVLGALAEKPSVDPSIVLRLRSVENRLRQRDTAVLIGRLSRRTSDREPDLPAAA